MAENALQVEIRQGSGKGVARKLRVAGRIPGVCYGKGDPTVALTLDARALRRLLEGSEAGMNTLIHLEMQAGGGLDGKMVLLRELQRDPVHGRYLHADFYTVDLQQKVDVSVPIHLTGKAPGVELGGIVDQALRELDLVCLPLSIPQEITVDVSSLDVGDSLHVRDIVLPAGVELSSDANLSVVSVVAPKVEEEPAAAEEELAEGEVPAEGEPAVEGETPAAAAESEGGGDKRGD